MNYKLPPMLSEFEEYISWLEEQPWVTDRRVAKLRTMVEAYAITALEQQRQIEAQGVPDGCQLVQVDKLRALKASICGDYYQGEGWEIRTISEMLESAPPAPEVGNRNPQASKCDARIAELEKKLQEALDHIAEINDIMDSID